MKVIYTLSAAAVALVLASSSVSAQAAAAPAKKNPPVQTDKKMEKKAKKDEMKMEKKDGAMAKDANVAVATKKSKKHMKKDTAAKKSN